MSQQRVKLSCQRRLIRAFASQALSEASLRDSLRSFRHGQRPLHAELANLGR